MYMKKLTLFFLLTFSAAVMFAQDLPATQVPAPVASALTKAYPKAEHTKWKLKDDVYHADFKIAKDKYDVWFDKAGTITKRKYEISNKDLPAAVQATLTKEYSAYTVHDAEKTEAKGVSTYKVELKKAGEERKITFGEDGKVVEKKKDGKE
jgi:hypothetical protein